MRGCAGVSVLSYSLSEDEDDEDEERKVWRRGWDSCVLLGRRGGLESVGPRESGAVAPVVL